MKNDSLKTIFKVSRPRFWIYLAGPFLVGYMLGINEIPEFLNPQMALYLVYFLFFANLFVYGVNDLYDQDTDKHNPKKFNKENNLTEEFKPILKFGLFCSFLVSLSLLFFEQSNLGASIIFIAFLFLSFFYSAKPLRFKAHPIVDFASNILYALPAFFGFYLSSNQMPSLLVVLGVFFWTSAMHLFSAIPDIEYDKSAGLKTTAVVLGRSYSLLLVIIFWALSSYIIFAITQNIFIGLASYIYPLLPFYCLISKTNQDSKLDKLYWAFPYINFIFGFVLFWYLAFNKFF